MQKYCKLFCLLLMMMIMMMTRTKNAACSIYCCQLHILTLVKHFHWFHFFFCTVCCMLLTKTNSIILPVVTLEILALRSHLLFENFPFCTFMHFFYFSLRQFWNVFTFIFSILELLKGKFIIFWMVAKYNRFSCN